MAAASAAAASQRSNVLVIITDDQGYGDFSFTGNPYLKTPHIDALAASGARFERFYVNSFCSPTRAALLTGRYPLRCGVWGVTHSKETMRSEEVTLAEAFREAGYRTGCFGKWHNGEQHPYTPLAQGFEAFVGFRNGHINQYFDAELWHGHRQTKSKGYISDVLTDEAIRFVQAADQRPFLCYLAFNAPHSPYQVPDKYYDKFQQQGLEPAAAAFYGMCENIDDNVGRLLAAIEAARLTDNTIVVFLTDNGSTAGAKLYNAGMRGGKTSVHEGGSRVPLLVRWPTKVAQGRVIEPIVSHIDLYPTLLDLCNVKPSQGPPLDGRSLRPLLEGSGDLWPDRVLYLHNPISENNRYPGAVRTEQYRLVREVRGPGGGSSARPADRTATPWQLYDMHADPAERNDLAADRPEVVARLSRLYEDWLDDVSSGGLRRFPIQVGHAEENPVTVNAPQAYFSGDLNFASGPGYAHDWLTNWNSTSQRVWFDVDVVTAGDYELELRYACEAANAGAKLQIVCGRGGGARAFEVPAGEAPHVPLPHRDAQGLQKYRMRQWATLRLGTFQLAAGRQEISLAASELPGAAFIDFKALSLRRIDP